jgi:Ser/Thr protein kinase RdoA (MazF antagonist)
MSASIRLDSADELLSAARSFFPTVGHYTPLGASTGFSGSRFARVEAEGEVWCLRRWPDDFPRVGLQAIHRVLCHSRSRGFDGVPALARLADGATILTRGTALHDAQRWLPGEPLDGTTGWARVTPNGVFRLPPGQLADLAATLARFHRSTAALATVPGLPTHAIRAQFAALVAELPGRCAALGAASEQRASSEGRALAHRWLQRLPQVVAIAARVVREDTSGAQERRVICHGDLWARHIYMVGGRFGGFVDFESLSWGSPAIDLAQLLLHFAGWEARTGVIQAYERIVPLQAAEHGLLRLAALNDLASEALWSLGQLSSAPATRPADAIHEHNLRALLPALETIAAELQADESAGC